MYCEKIGYNTKKEAKKSARHLSRSAFGGYSAKFGIYHCKECNRWHTYTLNSAKLKHNAEHARSRSQLKRRIRA